MRGGIRCFASDRQRGALKWIVHKTARQYKRESEAQKRSRETVLLRLRGEQSADGANAAADSRSMLTIAGENVERQECTTLSYVKK